jgi:hypothetical protein
MAFAPFNIYLIHMRRDSVIAPFLFDSWSCRRRHDGGIGEDGKMIGIARDGSAEGRGGK